jgi:hypothetical protein
MNAGKLAQIQALLAKAEATTFDSEAEALRAKAFELIARYGLEEALTASRAEIKVEPVKEFFTIEGNYHNRRVLLLHGIARAMRCETIMMTKRLRKGQKPSNTTLLVYGMPSDIERVKVLWFSLNLQMGSEMNRSLVHKPKGVHGRTWCVNFVNAYAVEVAQRVQAAENQAEDNEVQFGDSRFALVLVANKEMVSDMFTKENRGVQKVNFAQTASSAGWAAGSRAGEKANLGSSTGSLSGSSRKALN